MIEIVGKYGIAKVFTDLVDEGTISQIYELLNQEFIEGSKVSIMPDCHVGTGCVIGTTITIKDKVVPNLVGVDIGCGMLTVKLGKISLDFKALDDFINEHIPAGQNVNDKILDTSLELKDLKCYDELKNKAYLQKSLGSLGGGNHFIEVDVDDEGNYYLVIHKVSRNLGTQVADIYQKAAIQYHKDKIFNVRLERDKVISSYKAQGRQKEIEKKLKELKELHIQIPMPEALAYLEGELFDAYMHDMAFCQEFAKKNRYLIAEKICSFLKLNLKKLEYFETVHNYINMKDMILRKGAISAYEGEMVLIPINMRDGCIIGKGKSSKEYNCSAPHGAGRLLSRSKANEVISLEDYQKSMEGIYSTSVKKSTIDESPFAYKPIEAIIENIKDTVEILMIIKPVYNFKAS